MSLRHSSFLQKAGAFRRPRFPNTEVKPCSAEDSALATGCENRKMPTSDSEYFLCKIALRFYEPYSCVLQCLYGIEEYGLKTCCTASLFSLLKNLKKLLYRRYGFDYGTELSFKRADSIPRWLISMSCAGKNMTSTLPMCNTSSPWRLCIISVSAFTLCVLAQSQSFQRTYEHSGYLFPCVRSILILGF